MKAPSQTHFSSFPTADFTLTSQRDRVLFLGLNLSVDRCYSTFIFLSCYSNCGVKNRRMNYKKLFIDHFERLTLVRLRRPTLNGELGFTVLRTETRVGPTQSPNMNATRAWLFILLLTSQRMVERYFNVLVDLLCSSR